jgi:hypothetical protein
MNIEPDPRQPYLGVLTQQVTASTPIARFVPTAAAVPEETVDQWVEQELQRGRRRMRAGLGLLALLAAVAIPLILFVK